MTVEPCQAPRSRELPETLGVIPWTVGLDDGHDLRSGYVETFWLPVLGPSTVLLMRRLADELDRCPDGLEISTATLSRDIGLGERLGHRSAFARTLDRCQKFHLVLVEGAVVHVRRTLPDLSPRQVGRLSPSLRERHAHEQHRSAPESSSDRRAELIRAAHLARTLLDLGDAAHETERQLDRWGFPPAISWHAVHCAQHEELAAL